MLVQCTTNEKNSLILPEIHTVKDRCVGLEERDEGRNDKTEREKAKKLQSERKEKEERKGEKSG